MVIVIVKMNVLPVKFLELKQTLLALSGPTREEKGCLSHSVFQDIENEDSFMLVGHWESLKDLDDHMGSDRFAVLIGTRSLLSCPPEITINKVSHSSESEL